MKQDIKKDTLKAQLDDALRQSVDGTLLVNPEMAVKQLEIIFQEQTKVLQDKLKTAESKAVDYSIQHDHYLEQIEQLKEDKRELIEGIFWIRDEYINCVNDCDEITERMDDLLTKHK